ncbi:M1 family metallopeptidase [Crocinitomicaceae bacterium]|nr:M1 family metallopeptidase [Crocinitomicaceae bacterium]MDC0257432.1 M1 family metallopeptidase [Crocinitomicaceae bacterium]
MLQLTFPILFTSLFASFTATSQDYWQQEVNYTINVELDDENHFLNAYEEFEYINNSPDVLDTIYMHVWPNAYKNGETALAKQQYGNKKQILKYGSEEIKGFIDQLDFKVGGQPVKWEYHPEFIDVCYLVLDTPLNPGKKIKVSTPFRVQIPSGSISRLGHIKQSYQITQWYPKPAVYDKNGWNAFPYLNQGEFYSEYGSFDVSITLPDNYVVGATGDLQTDSEIAFLNERAQTTATNVEKGTNYTKFGDTTEKNGFPESSKSTKTIRYTQKNVHDFAWFADKRFNVLKSQVELPHSGRMVTSWAMYTEKEANLWIKASEYLNDAVYHYSLWNGDYPYNNVTAVDGTISAGGGMEYPNVTVIGRSGNDYQLEVVLVHEVGHNWFYGQLGTNERVHGWMDEGMNTLNEVRYMQTKYPDNQALSDMVLGGAFHFNDLDHHDMSDLSYRMVAALGEDQPIETHSAKFTSANYGVVMYQKTGLVFLYLRDYLGDELFDKSMRAYYSEWEFKHPQPEDMRRSLEKASGKDLGWLFDDLIQTTNHVDYKLKKVKIDENVLVTVKNIGQVDGPIEVATLSNGKVVETKWIEPGAKKSVVQFENTEIDAVRIDPGIDIPEINRQNNSWKKAGLFGKWEGLNTEFLIGDNEAEKTNLFWLPMIAGNLYDGFMIGPTFHNFGIPFNKFGYLVSPFFSFKREFVSGVADFNYNFYPKRNLKISKFGLSVKSFKQDSSVRANDGYYLAVLPYWTAKIGHRGDDKPFTQTIRVQSMYRQDVLQPTTQERVGGYVEYAFTFSKPDHYFVGKARNEFITEINSNNDDQIGRFMIEGTYKYRYLKNKQKRWIEIRGFIGNTYHEVFTGSSNTFPYSFSLSGATGMQDLFLDEYFMGRNEFMGTWSQQRIENMGGFKSTTYYGTNTGTMVAGNLYMDLPFKPGLFGAFLDAGSFQDNSGSMSPVALNAGLGVRLGNIFGIYFPMWMSDELVQSYGPNLGIFDEYGRKIRFTLHLNLVNKPLNLSTFI